MIGTVVKTFGRYHTVRHDDGLTNCVLRGRMRKDPGLKRFSEPVAVGDRVAFELNDDGSGAISRIEERKNAFTRKDRGNSREDIIAANLDQLVIIQSFARPRLNPRFVDRVAVRGSKEGITVVLCVNKSDLSTRAEIADFRAYYRGSGLAIIVASAEKGSGMDSLRDVLHGKVSLFVGTSGVGKSTILNRLYPGLDLRISEVSESTGKGRHTTTNAEMISPDAVTGIIDTPGFREFGLMDIEPDVLAGYFYEYGDYASRCRFRPCTHDHEPGCEVKKLVEEGEISQERYVSYLNILYSIKDYYETRYQ